MINNNVYNSPDRSNKLIAPNSPQTWRKNVQFGSNAPIQGIINLNEHPRKDTNIGQMSPQHHYYPQKQQNGKHLDTSMEKQYNLENIVRQISDRMIKISQKLGQHESILIKMTQTSIENNKQQYKKSNKIDSNKSLDALNDTISKLRRDFDDYKAETMPTRQIQVKNQLFSQLIHKSQERMREEMQSVFRLTPKNNTISFSDQRVEQFDRNIRKLQKNISLNTNKIFGAYEKIDSVSSSLDGHIDLINAELNKAINKIVSFVNDKVSKPLNENIVKITQRIQKIESHQNFTHFGRMKPSFIKSQKPTTVAEYKQILIAYNQQIIISQKIYYIDIDGYLLDQEYYYLLNKHQEKIRLDQAQIKFLRNQNLIT